MWRMADGEIVKNLEDSGRKSWYGAQKLDEYDEESYKFLMSIALENETPYKIYEQQLLEMANLMPSSTGLPVEIWLDIGKSFEKSGHSNRIKFRNGYSRSAEFVPLVINNEPYVPKINGKAVKIKITGKELDILKKFVVANLDVFKEFGKTIFDAEDFLKNMKGV